MSKMSRGMVLLLMGGSIILQSGCASFPGNKIPEADTLHCIKENQFVPVDYSVDFQLFGGESSFGLSELEKLSQEIFTEAKVFEKIQLGTGLEKAHLDVTLNNHGNIPLACISGFICGFTFLIIPGYAEDEYTLTVDVLVEGELVKQYQYHDTMSTWIGWVFIPFMGGHMPQDISRDVIGNMLRTFVHDLKKDNLLMAEH